MVIRPMRHHNVAAEFKQLYKKVLREEKTFFNIDPYRILTLRASQLPFCPLAFFYERATKGMRGTLDLLGSYYTSVGTTVHEVMQTYLGRTDQFLANWECPKCGKWHERTTQPKCCGVFSKYHEIGIKNKYIVGHIDAIYIDANGKYWILDFKTTSLQGAPKKEKDPGQSYIDQIESYAWSVWKQYRIKVEGVILVFLPRDNPTKPALYVKPLKFDFDMPRIKSKLKGYYVMHREAIEASTKKEVIDLLKYGRCKNPYCSVCANKDFKGKAALKEGMLHALSVGKSHDRVPILSMVEKQIERNSRNSRKSKEKRNGKSK